MQRLLLITTLFLSLSLNAQEITLTEAEAIADQLAQKEILNLKGKETLLMEIRNKAIEVEHPSTVKPISYTSDTLSKETILQFCAMAFAGEQVARIMDEKNIEHKIKQEDSLVRKEWVAYPPLSGLGAYGGKFINCISPNRSTIGLTRTRTLEDFRQIGLISETVYQECKQALVDASVKDEVELTAYMLNRSIYYRYYAFNLKEQKEFIDLLVSYNILSPEGRDLLLQSYQPFELKTIPQILSFSSRYVLVELSAVDAEPQVVYPIIFQAIQGLLPAFHFEDLRVNIQEELESNLIREDIQLSFQVGGQKYTNTFFHNYRKQVPDSLDRHILPSKVDQDFQKGINKWLIDTESLYRLYAVNIPDKDEAFYGGRRVGLLLLKEGEAEIISRDPYQLSQESFDTRLSRRNLDKLLAEFQAQGFFTHLSAREMQEAKEKIASTDAGSLEEVLLQFPRTVVLFDWETGNLENPYEDLTRQFEAAARGSFVVTNILDEYRKGREKAKRVMYGFAMNGKKYEALLEFNDDWLDPQFMELIKKALKENAVDGDFYYCIDNGQESGYIFLTSNQHRFIREKYPDLLKEH